MKELWLEIWHELKDIMPKIFDAASFWEMSIVALFVLFCVVLHRLDKEKGGKFYFRDLFSSGDWNGKASTPRLGYFGAFLTHSLVVLHAEMKNGIDYAMISLYALIWSGAYVALKAIEARANKPSKRTEGEPHGSGTTEAAR